MTDYQSSVLKCCPEPNHCAVCRVALGGRDVDDLLRAITILDIKLADAEKTNRHLWAIQAEARSSMSISTN